MFGRADDDSIKHLAQLQQQLNQIREQRDNLPEPEEVEKMPEISDEERDNLYDGINEYAEHLETELEEYDQQVASEAITGKPMSLPDIKKTTKDVKRSDIKNAHNGIKEIKDLENTKGNEDLERNE